jgi:hypothetical protein
VKRGKKKKRVKEKKTVELLKLLPKHILTKQIFYTHLNFAVLHGSNEKYFTRV